MNVLKSKQPFRTLVRATGATVVALSLAGTAVGALASTLDTRTFHEVEAASLYDTPASRS